jgi:hypothetical protein
MLPMIQPRRFAVAPRCLGKKAPCSKLLPQEREYHWRRRSKRISRIWRTVAWTLKVSAATAAASIRSITLHAQPPLAVN